MRYGIFCKEEYWNSWPLILKEELAEFATVEIVYPAQKRTIPESVNSISSPSGSYSMTFNLDGIDGDDVCVYKAVQNFIKVIQTQAICTQPL